MWFHGHRWILTLCSFLMLKPYCMHFTFVTPEVAVTRRMSRLSIGPAVMIQWWMGITVSLFLVHPDLFGFKLPLPNPGDVGQPGLEPHPTLVNRPIHAWRCESATTETTGTTGRRWRTRCCWPWRLTKASATLVLGPLWRRLKIGVAQVWWPAYSRNTVHLSPKVLLDSKPFNLIGGSKVSLYLSGNGQSKDQIRSNQKIDKSNNVK